VTIEPNSTQLNWQLSWVGSSDHSFTATICTPRTDHEFVCRWINRFNTFTSRSAKAKAERVEIWMWCNDRQLSHILTANS